MSDANVTSSVPDSSLSSRLPTLHTSSRTASIANIRNSLRIGQQPMADWKGGPLAVSAVPGAGKSTGMAAAAAIAIARQYENKDSLRPTIRRQLVVVTFTRSAAANIKAKIRQYLREGLSLPQTGFVVYTLHGLALNIATRHPELSGLELDYVTLITPNQSHRFIRTAVEKWIANNSRLYALLMEGMQFDGEETERLRRQSVLRTEVLPELATAVIHEAKSSGMTPEDLHQLSQQSIDAYEVLKIAAGLYEQYQTLMSDKDFIDYDDMILAALRVLENESARKIEQKQVFAVFEDEAQDSSPLQTKLLEILASGEGEGERGRQGDGENLIPINNYQLPITNYQSPIPKINIIRVGDPNQAINSTFTPADPIYFRQFCQECASQGLLATMDQAGRSSKIIIETANFALEWVNSLYQSRQNNHAQKQSSPHSPIPQSPPSGSPLPSTEGTSAREWTHHPLPLPFRYQRILPVDANDPQPNANPAAIGRGVEIHTPEDIHNTVELLSKRIIELFPEDNENNGSAAILVRENRQGNWLSQQLRPICKKHNILLYDVGEQDRHSHVPEEILAVLQFCDRPHSPDFLKAALGVLVKRRLIEPQDLNALASLPEEFLYPSPLAPLQTEAVKKTAEFCRDLLNARLELPLYQIISFIALKLDYQQAELATADKLSERINQSNCR